MNAPKTILVVEDDEALREIYCLVLVEEGFHVYEASNGCMALDMLLSLEAAKLPDCILLDLLMPIMSGNEFLHVIKARYQSRLGAIPVIVLSAFGDDVDMDQVFLKIQKPATLNQIYLSVYAAINCKTVKPGY